jgi:hypothetical protein
MTARVSSRPDDRVGVYSMASKALSGRSGPSTARAASPGAGPAVRPYGQPPPYICLGSQVMSGGTMKHSATISICRATNGMMPT